jgi:hypothetical protein
LPGGIPAALLSAGILIKYTNQSKAFKIKRTSSLGDKKLSKPATKANAVSETLHFPE